RVVVSVEVIERSYPLGQQGFVYVRQGINASRDDDATAGHRRPERVVERPDFLGAHRPASVQLPLVAFGDLPAKLSGDHHGYARLRAVGPAPIGSVVTVRRSGEVPALGALLDRPAGQRVDVTLGRHHTIPPRMRAETIVPAWHSSHQPRSWSGSISVV